METEVSHIKTITTDEAWKHLKNFFEKTCCDSDWNLRLLFDWISPESFFSTRWCKSVQSL